MPSPHEFATLILVKDAPDQIEPDCESLRSLLERQLVIVELLLTGRRPPRITLLGDAFLQAVERIP